MIQIEPSARPLKAILEIPADWMLNPIDGHHNRTFFSNFLAALSLENLPIHLYQAPFGGDEVARENVGNGILFSYHSTGEKANQWHLKETPIRPYFSIDRSGHSGWAEIARNRNLQNRAKRYPLGSAQTTIERIRQRFLTQGESKYPQSGSPANLPGAFVFLPLQVQSDPVTRFSMISAQDILTTAATIAEEQKTPLVVKRHPFCDSETLKDQLAALVGRNRFVIETDGSVHDIIPRCHSVITVNSGVGLEALIHGKPVYSAGLSEWFPVCHPIKHVTDIVAAFSPDQQPHHEEVVRYLGFLFNEYWVNSNEVGDIHRRIKYCLNLFRPQTFSEEVPWQDALDASRLDLLIEQCRVGTLRREKEALTYNCTHLQEKVARLEAAFSEESRLRNELELQLSQTRAQLEVAEDTCHRLTSFLERLMQSRSGRVLRIRRRLERAGITLPPHS